MFSDECNSFNEDDIAQLIEYKLTGERLLGIEQEIEQGIKQNTKEIVQNMIKEKIDIKLISKITGLEEKEIIKIKTLYNFFFKNII